MFNHAVILAAGRGIRLIYMTSRIPKALVDVCGLPLINYSLLQLQKQIPQITVTIGYKGDLLREALKDQKVSFLDTTGEGNAWWIFHTAFRELDEPILVLPCDLLTQLDCKWLFKVYQQLQAPAFLQIPVAHPEGFEGDFMEEEEGRVTRFSRAGGIYYCSGLSILNPARLNQLLEPHADLPEVCQALVKIRQLYCSELYPYPWYSVNTKEQLATAIKWLKNEHISNTITGNCLSTTAVSYRDFSG